LQIDRERKREKMKRKEGRREKEDEGGTPPRIKLVFAPDN